MINSKKTKSSATAAPPLAQKALGQSGVQDNSPMTKTDGALDKKEDLPKLVSKQRLHTMKKWVKEPSPRTVNPEAIYKIKELLTFRRGEQTYRYSKESESKTEDLVQATLQTVGYSRHKEFMSEETIQPPTPAEKLHPTKYLEHLHLALLQFIQERKAYHSTMTDHYAEMSAQLAALCGPNSCDPKEDALYLPQVKQVRTSIKRDLSLVQKDIELMLYLVESSMPLAMQLKPGIFESVEGQRDMKAVAYVREVVMYEEARKTWNTPSSSKNKLARENFWNETQIFAHKRAIALLHPSFQVNQDVRDLQKIFEGATQDIDFREVAAKMDIQRTPGKLLPIDELMQDAIFVKDALGLRQEIIAKTSGRRTMTKTIDVGFDVSRVPAYTAAIFRADAFTPLHLKNLVGDSIEKPIKDLKQLRSAQYTVSEFIADARSMVSKTLLAQEYLLHQLLQGTEQEAAQASATFAQISQDLKHA